MCDSPMPKSAKTSGPEQDSAQHSASRRAVLQTGIGAASLAGLTGLSLAFAAPAAAAAKHSRRVNARTRAILVGTAGGPIWRQADGLRGISTVVEVGGARYLVDAGHGASAGLWGAGAVGPRDGMNDLTAYRAGFLTHLHSDHTTDLANFLVQGFCGGGLGGPDKPFILYGPGNRGQLPHSFPPGRPVDGPFNPADPTPGTVTMVRNLLQAFATDINDRMYDAGSPRIDKITTGQDIALPDGISLNFDGPPPAMKPFTIFEDDLVHVTATLVDHGQLMPAYAFRFDSGDGSIVISGDTTLNDNLMSLADGCDLLLHEIIDYDSVNASIEALNVPPEVKEAFRNHMFGAHTTEKQLKQLIKDINVKTLALHHLVPGSIGEHVWHRIAGRIGHGSRTDVVAGLDNMVIGVGR